jgi:hypothetical protein
LHTNLATAALIDRLAVPTAANPALARVLGVGLAARRPLHRRDRRCCRLTAEE